MEPNYNAALKVTRLPPEVSTAERCFLHTLIVHRNGETGDCFPSLQRIAREMGASLITAKRALNKLRDRGLLSVGKRATHDGKGNTYSLNLGKLEGIKLIPSKKVSNCQSEGIKLIPEKVSNCPAEGIKLTPEQTRNSQSNRERTEARADLDRAISETAQSFDANPAQIAPWESGLFSETAKMIGDNSPSRVRWHKFIARNGPGAFTDVRDELLREIESGRHIYNPGAYFNSKLDAYTPPASRPEAKAKRYPPEEWPLCAESCAFFQADPDGKCCKRGMKIPPDHKDRPRPIPARECPCFKDRGGGQ